MLYICDNVRKTDQGITYDLHSSDIR